MNSFILMIILNLGYGQKQVLFQEFSSQERCKLAMAEVSKIGPDTIEHAICLPK